MTSKLDIELNVHTRCTFYGKPAFISVCKIDATERVFTIEVVLFDEADDKYFIPLIWQGSLRSLASICNVDRIEFTYGVDRECN